MARIIAAAAVLATTLGGPSLARAVAPAKERLLFMSLVREKALEETAAGLEGLLVETMEREGTVTLVRTRETRQVLSTQAERMLAGCRDRCDAEAQRVLATLDARYLGMGRLSRVGRRLVLQASVVRVDTGEPVGRATIQADDPDALIGQIEPFVLRLLGPAGLTRRHVDPAGHLRPSFQLLVKAGNGSSHLAGALFDGSALLSGLRLNLEGDFFATDTVALFIEVGTTLGGGEGGAGDDLMRLSVTPVSFGAKRVWTFDRLRAWAGVSLGPGIVALMRGDTSDLRTAFATTALVGVDFRLASFLTLLAEGTTSLTDAVFALGTDAVTVPVVVGITAGLSFLFF